MLQRMSQPGVVSYTGFMTPAMKPGLREGKYHFQSGEIVNDDMKEEGRLTQKS